MLIDRSLFSKKHPRPADLNTKFLVLFFTEHRLVTWIQSTPPHWRCGSTVVSTCHRQCCMYLIIVHYDDMMHTKGFILDYPSYLRIFWHVLFFQLLQFCHEWELLSSSLSVTCPWETLKRLQMKKVLQICTCVYRSAPPCVYSWCVCAIQVPVSIVSFYAYTWLYWICLLKSVEVILGKRMRKRKARQRDGEGAWKGFKLTGPF